MRPSLPALLACWCLVFASSIGFTQEDTVPDEPTLTVRIGPPSPFLQEEIVQVVRVISPHPFEELVLDLPPVEGAEAITLQKPKNRKFETYGGEGYIFETSRAIFPKQSGELRIPPVRVSGSVGVSRKEKEPFALREDALILDVRPPPYTFSVDWWLIARDVEIEESWSKAVDTLRVGDRVTRSINVTVTGVTGAHLPELEQGRSIGLTVLPGQTQRSTEITPSGVIGSIKRSFDIRIDGEQPINISPVRVVWWNTNTEEEQRSAAPATRIEPLPRDVEGLVANAMAEAATAREVSRRGIVVVALGAVALVTVFGFWFLHTGRKVRPEDRRLEQALKIGNGPIDTLRALGIWSDAAFPNDPPLSLEQVGDKLGPEARQHIARLQKAAFGQNTDRIDPNDVARDVLRIAQNSRRSAKGHMLTEIFDWLFGPEKRLPVIDQRQL